MSENQATTTMVKIVELLTPLESEERQRVVKAALTLLGDSFSPAVKEESVDKEDLTDVNFSPKVNNWVKQNDLTMQDLEQVFHFSESDIEFIASDVPGKNHKDKTHNAYIICGVQRFLSEGAANFDDKTARQLCENLGCYNQANHSVYMKSIGNAVTGSKSKGWALTVPGLKKAATLIKELAGN